MRTICIVCATFVLMACFDLQVGYYIFLRTILFVVSLTIIVNELKQKKDFKAVEFIAIALIFNPIVPIYLYKKSLWIVIDILTAMFFLIHGFKEKKQPN